MTTDDDYDLDKLIQEELDALSLDGSIDDGDDDDEDDKNNENDTKAIESEEVLNETRQKLEREMHERLAAFENEVNVNMDRCIIDYSEIDELLKKPIGNNEKDIQTNVARACGIDREELDRILHNINTEELPLDSSINSDSNEYEVPKVEIIKRDVKPIETDESAESTPRQQEDPNKKLYDERLAESHRRMLADLALLEQRRKEEEERYAIVLQEQQVRLAEEYRRLQENLDETARQTQNEKLQFEALCREQERVTNERQNKMAIIIQSWYRGKRVYHKHHEEIIKRATPALKTIAKNRKKKEQMNKINADKLTKIIEKENHPKVEITSIPLPTSDRVSSPLTDVVPKQSKLQPLAVKEINRPKEDLTKKKKIISKQTIDPPISSTPILQLENPADFIPTVYPEERLPIQTKEQQRPKSSNKQQPLPKLESTQMSTSPSNSFSNNKRLNMLPVKSNNTMKLSTTMTRSNTFDKNIESPISPSIENNSLANSLIRSRTFDKEMKNFQRPSVDSTSSISLNRSQTFVNESKNIPPSIESISPRKSIDITPRQIESRSDILINRPESAPPPIETILPRKSIDFTSTLMDNRSDLLINNSKNISSSDKKIPFVKSIDVVTANHSIPVKPDRPSTPRVSTPVKLDRPSTPRESVPVKPDRPSTPRVSTPRKAPVEEQQQQSNQSIYPFLNEARRWAEHTHDITYFNLIRSSEETIQQMPTRKPGGNLRKLPDIDSKLLIKAAKNQSPKEVHYLHLEQILTPCSLSLIGTTFPNLTHLILRQCKLVQLTGLDSCSSLIILDLEGNWIEQIHLQLNQLEYLNLSRNRLTSLLAIQTPRLKYLDVSKNRLTRLNGIETLVNLNILLATNNQLLTTIGLQGCTNLFHIDLSDNHLVEMEQIEQCPLLLTLKASSNSLIQLPNLLNSVLLHELNLSSNSLTSFDELLIGSWLPFLTHLRLSNNSFHELSSIKLPSLIELDLACNQLSDVSIVKRFINTCPILSRLNLEQNPVVCDINETLIPENKSFKSPLSVLPHLSIEKSTELIQLYLTFLSNMTSMLIKLRQIIEHYQTEPFTLLKSIHNQCQQYYEQKKIEPIEISQMIIPTNEIKVLSEKEKGIVRLQAHWRRKLLERKLKQRQQAAQKIQARWRGYVLRQRMRTVRRYHSQQQQTFDEIDLTEFEFDEAAFDARFQRPRTPVTRIKEVWQSQQHSILPTPIIITELPLQNSPRSSSAASSRAKPIVEPLDMSSRPQEMTNEWGFTPSSSTAALMLKRAQKMKWNAERRHKRQHMDAYQRLQMARNNEQPPGSLRLARPVTPPVTVQPRPNRVYEWVHTQVARFDESALGNINSPRNERKRLPSLDGSTDSTSRMRPNEILQQQQQQQQNRWSSSSISIRQPPPLLPPISGQIPRA
ncbi:unnamed protein product [Adineta steineri]|uniref:Uncharacterized protein n=3 Tax=Adineta steineri TaxID=433720 RepID=A0A814M1C1_9BILA|nr:unnamed protein product [Adineta steineri]